jgi:peroxiredoxin
VIGVSVDISYEDLKNSNEAWSRVEPFVEAHKVNYPILMGDDQVTKRYDIQALPLTYLIDKRGRIAASYAGVVDKDDVESNIQAILKESKN